MCVCVCVCVYACVCVCVCVVVVVVVVAVAAAAAAAVVVVAAVVGVVSVVVVVVIVIIVVVVHTRHFSFCPSILCTNPNGHVVKKNDNFNGQYIMCVHFRGKPPAFLKYSFDWLAKKYDVQ